jgi:hypothetical protein
VLAIAAAVIVLGGGATAVALLLHGGGGATAAPDTTALTLHDTTRQPAIESTAVRTGDTTRSLTGGGTELPGGGPVPADTSPARPPIQPAVDSARLDAEVFGLLDRLGSAGEDAAVQRALQIAQDPRAPKNLRAEAAAIAATVIVNRDQPQACRLWQQARTWMPSNPSYLKALQSAGCGS